MAERNIKPVARISRHLPLKIGGNQAATGRQTEQSREAADTADEATGDRITHARSEADPQTYSAPDVREDKPDTQAARDEAIEAGRREGYDRGHASGYDAGYEKGRAEAHEAAATERQTERSQLTAVLDALHHPIAAIRDEMVDSITEGALDLARRLVGEALTVDATLIRDTLLRILDEAAAHNGPGARLQLRIAPRDREITERLIENRRASDLSVDLIDDDKLARGDVQATLVHDNGDPANQVEWDARLETRWQTIRQALRNPQPS